MVFFNYATMQMAAKIVYYGPGLCGKTTNLHHIYAKTSPQSRGEMVSLETETDRTLFFDLLPIDVGVIGGFKTRLQLYTVPGQVFYNTTRKLVLKGVDGIVYVADSQKAMLDANVESLHNLRENLAEIGLSLDEIPLVLQLNKRDLPNISPVDTMLDAMDPDRRAEWVESVASTGIGVFETLKVISKLTLRTLRRRMTGDEPSRPAPSARAVQFRVQSNENRPPHATVVATTPVPPAHLASAPIALETPSFDEIAELEAKPQAPIETEAALTAADIDRYLVADAPVAEAPIADVPAPAPEIVFDTTPAAAGPVLAPEPLMAEPEIDFSQDEKPVPEPEVKTVKVRSSVDVMAELEALRKRATQASPKAAKRDALAELASLRPKRDIQRTLNLHLPPEVFPRAKSVRVTLSFEDEGHEVVESQEQTLDLGDTSDVQSLSVNLKIDLG